MTYPFSNIAAERLSRLLHEDPLAIQPLFVRPPKPEMGDLGFPCFSLAKTLRKPPPTLAQELAENIEKGEPFEEIRAEGPYLNFRISLEALSSATLQKILTDPERWGRSQQGEGKTVVIDYSSPNIAKPLGVHHIRSTILGAALARLYAACGWKVVTINHLGDWGTNFGQLMVSYQRACREHPEVPVDVHALLRLYQSFHAAAEEDDRLEEEARMWFKKLEEGDEEARRLWRIFVEESLRDLQRLYDRLGVTFDAYLGESFFNDKIPQTLERLQAKGLLQESEGATVVDLTEEGMPPCLILKRDGATTYATRDLAAAEYRYATYGFNRCLYVVANQQELHFRQVFAVLRKMGYSWAEGMVHVKFGMLSFGPGIFGEEAATGSTRRGQVIFLEEVLDRAVSKAKTIILENAREQEVIDEADTLAEKVGVGAVIFTEFLQRRMKDVLFMWERALNLLGDSGPYLQYTHARLHSVKRKYGKEIPSSLPWYRLTSPLEREILIELSLFPSEIERAVTEDEPSILADYLLHLAAAFNRFFTDKEQHRILGEDEELSLARMGLVEAVRITLARGLMLLGLAAPERM